MDYFIVFLLILIIFTFLSDKKMLHINEIENKIETLNEQMEEIYKDTLIITIEEKIEQNKEELIKYVDKKVKENSLKKYIILKDENVELSLESIKRVIANFINENKCICGFMANYEYQYVNHKSFKDIKEELEVAIINYLNIFSKSDINIYGVVMLRVSDFTYFTEKNKKVKVAKFSPNEDIKVVATKTRTNNILKRLDKIYDSDIKMVLKSGLLILVGVSVTANFIYSIFSFKITEIIIAGIMYWCYQYVLKYMYKPIGKYKVAAKYLFPIFLVFYLLLKILKTIKKRRNSNKKVQAS